MARSIREEIEAIAGREADPQLRAIELAIYVEEVLGIRLPPHVLVDDGRDPLPRVLRAAGADR